MGERLKCNTKNCILIIADFVVFCQDNIFGIHLNGTRLTKEDKKCIIAVYDVLKCCLVSGKDTIMFKKIILFTIILCTIFAFTSCKDDDKKTALIENWNGQYVWQDEETEEFKIVTIETIGEKKVSVKCESAKESVSFEGEAKSETGRYIAVNLGNKSLKVTLSSSYSYIEMDDMWTDEDLESRIENWSGRYTKLTEEDEVPKFGNPSWNGKYICEENGQIVSVYGIKEGYVLFTYNGSDEDGEINENRLKFLESDATRAVYTKDERLVMVDLIRANEKIEITDMYMDDRENIGMSGIYKKYVPEKKDEQ